MDPSLSLPSLILALQSIENDDIETLTEILNRLPIETLSVESSDSLLAQMMNAASRSFRHEAGKAIFERWAKTYPPQQIDFFSTLFKNNLFNDDTFTFLAKTFQQTSYLTVMTDLCRDDSNENLVRTCKNVIQAYGEQPASIYDLIRVEADTSGNFVIYNFMVTKILPSRPYANKPDWVKDFRSDTSTPLPHSDDLNEQAQQILLREYSAETEIPDTETLIGYLTDGMAHAGISFTNIEEVRQTLRGILPNLSSSQTRDLLTESLGDRVDEVLRDGRLSTLQDNTTLFRILGPSNPILNSKAEDFLRGDDRMFLCALYDYDEEEEEIQPWFTGNCMVCMRRIAHYWYAVRVPKPQGGWAGCYCSWEHAREDVFNRETPDVAGIAILDVVEPRVIDVGIQDRIEDEFDASEQQS
ncbi:hypothetical protein pv_146 [Pithovirus sibericum]|uniref:Uncharacterized protein n=1 Tax=Pithovirus sibericum TaxID=1450746 RepID=W5S4N7_9VIRU|nr:hypothetical protein pv_146 [Pithovirus sibericum]AHH01713.1 hypothetical protein pv_146 [Pithovirus sibericum]